MPPTASREHPRGGKRFRRGWGGRDPGCGWRPQPHQRHWACMPGGRALGASGKAGSRRCCPECPGRHAEVSYSPRLPMTEALGGCPGLPVPEYEGWASWERDGAPTCDPPGARTWLVLQGGDAQTETHVSRLCSSPREAFPSEAVFQVWSMFCQCQEAPWVM